MTTTCNKFHHVVSGDSCYDIAAAYAVDLADFYAWNPATGSTCTGLWVGYYVCVGVKTGTSPPTLTTSTKKPPISVVPAPTKSTTKPPTSVVPTPTKSTTKPPTSVVPTPTKSTIKPPTSVVPTPTKSTTKPPTGAVPTPTPIQQGMIKTCKKFHHVVSGDGCYDIAAKYKIALDDFYAWNPAVGKTCASLWVGYYVCIGVQ